MNKLGRVLACTTLAATLTMTSLTGCGNTLDGTKTVATVGKEEITAGTVNMMLRMTQAQMMSYYSMFGTSTTGMWENKGDDGKTYAESTKDDIMDQLHNLVLLEQHAKDYDVTITDEEQKELKAAAEKFMTDNDAETIAKLAVTQSDIEKLLELYSYQTKMYDLMTADVDTNVEDKEAQQSKITYCKVSTKATKDDEGNSTELTDEEKAAKKDQAQQILDKIKAQEDIAGADVDSLAKEVDESLSSSTATYSTNEDDEDSSLDAEVMKAAKELTEDGQLASDVIEGSDGYYVVRMDSVFDKDSTQTKKDSIVKERKQKAYDKLLKKWAKKTKISVNKKVWKTVTLTDEDVYSFKQADTSSETTDSTDSAETTEATENTDSSEAEESTETTENTEESSDSTQADENTDAGENADTEATETAE